MGLVYLDVEASSVPRASHNPIVERSIGEGRPVMCA